MTFSNVAGVVLDLDGFDNSFAYLHGGGTTGGDITLDGATLTVTTGTGAANFGGVISGAGAFVMNGASVQRLSGCDSSYTGTTTINAGSLYVDRSEEHTSELQSLMRISYAVFCLKKKKYKQTMLENDKQQSKYNINTP